MKTGRQLILEQIALSQEIISKTNINIVTCGHCGTILLHRLSEDKVTCGGCMSVMDTCDCPDLLYSGMENNEEFNR